MTQKTVQEAIAYRRSVRVYDPDQSIAARTATQFVVTVARKDKWKSRVKANLAFLKQQFEQQEVHDTKREKMANNYYTKIIPTLYTDFLGILGVLKRGLATIQGISKFYD